MVFQRITLKRTGIIGHRSEIEERCYDTNMTQEDFIRVHSIQKALCEENNANYFEINEDYDKEMQLVYDWIDGQVKDRRAECNRFSDTYIV